MTLKLTEEKKTKKLWPYTKILKYQKPQYDMYHMSLAVYCGFPAMLQGP